MRNGFSHRSSARFHDACLLCAVIAAALALVAGPLRDGFAAAAGAAEPRKDIETLDKMVTEAAKLFVQKKYQDAGTAARRAQEKMDELASGGDADAIRALWTALRSGKGFEAALASAFRGPPAQLVQTWLKQPAAANPN
jgi:hypothetical protein